MPSLAEPVCTQISSSWVEEAAKLPVAFAMVREDAAIDLSLLQTIKAAQPRMAMVASGGCTAALLCASGRLDRLTLIDTNPAQLALTALKLLLLEHAPEDRLAILGHRPMSATARLEALEKLLDKSALGLALDTLGPAATLAALGPDFSGRYEYVFAALRVALSEHQRQLQELLALADTVNQTALTAPLTPLGMALDDAFETVMTQDNLVRLFGVNATANGEEPFARHFLRRLRICLANLPANTNPYLQSMLLGKMPVHTKNHMLWLSQKQLGAEGVAETKCEYIAGHMEEVLAGMAKNSLDIVHLSNILDWLPGQAAGTTLAQASRALKSGGLIVIRRLNSSLDIQALSEDFRWLPQSKQLHAGDRSFFYKSLHVGEKL